MLLGIAVIIKPAILPLAGYFVLKREWKLVSCAAAVAGLTLLASVAAFGLQFNLDWYDRIIVGFAGQPMAAFNVQSLDAFLLRLQTGPDLLFDWHPRTLPVGLKVLRNILVGCLAALILLSIWRNSRRAKLIDDLVSPRPEYLEWCIVITFCVTISTVSWTHYYLLLLLPWSMYFAGALPMIDDRLTRGLVWASIICGSLPSLFPRADGGWLAHISSRSLQSIWLIGGLLLLWALLRSALLGQDEARLLFAANQGSIRQLPGKRIS
jgi:hypothetical protein